MIFNDIIFYCRKITDTLLFFCVCGVEEELGGLKYFMVSKQCQGSNVICLLVLKYSKLIENVFVGKPTFYRLSFGFWLLDDSMKIFNMWRMHFLFLILSKFALD